MTIGTRNSCMCASELKNRVVMIERRWFPDGRRVTNQAIVIKIICSMIRISGRLKIRLMTAIAIRCRVGIAILMTIGTLNSCMSASE